jgi:hypothetical protein
MRLDGNVRRRRRTDLRAHTHARALASCERRRKLGMGRCRVSRGRWLQR